MIFLLVPVCVPWFVSFVGTPGLSLRVTFDNLLRCDAGII